MASGNQIRLRVAGNRLKAARQKAFVGRCGRRRYGQRGLWIGATFIFNVPTDKSKCLQVDRYILRLFTKNTLIYNICSKICALQRLTRRDIAQKVIYCFGGYPYCRVRIS